MVYRAAVLTTLLHGAEAWPLSKKVIQWLTIFHQSAVRSLCRLTWKRIRRDHITSEDALRLLRLQPIEHYVRSRQLRWFGKVGRMEPIRIPNLLLGARPFVDDAIPKHPAGAPFYTLWRSLDANLRWLDSNLSIRKDWPLVAKDGVQWQRRLDEAMPLKNALTKSPRIRRRHHPSLPRILLS